MMNNHTFKDIINNKEIKIFHGSDVLVSEPKIIIPVRALDFGIGFYTTTNLEQAKGFSIRVKERNKTNSTYISIYNLNTELLKKNNCLIFDKPDKKWLDFVSSNRNGIYNGVIYDVIFGPVANDTIFKTFIAYQNGILSEKETIKRLKVSKLYNQLVFTNDKALKCLSFIGEYKNE